MDVVGATEDDLAQLRRSYGAAAAPANRAPDVTVRFVDEIRPDRLTRLRLVHAAFSPMGFHVVDRLEEHPIATLPFGSLDAPSEVTYVAGSRQTPYLTDILRLALLRHSYVALQAAAFVYRNDGYVVVGWPKSGKTGLALGSIAHGGQVLGDDWIAVRCDGSNMFALQPTVTISDWQARQLAGTVHVRTRPTFKAIRALERTYRRGLLPASATLERAMPRMLRALKTTLPVRHLGTWPVSARPSRAYLVEATDGPTRVEEFASAELARRASLINGFEWSGFRALYLAWRFANPGAVDQAMERVDQLEERCIAQALAGLDSFRVQHTYPGPIDDLFRIVSSPP